MSTTFRTVAGPARASFSVAGSEFIGHARPVESVDAAERFVEEIERTHAAATHNVPAYRVRVDGEFLREFASDAAEPSGSAGKPALNVLQQRALENVAVVVTRYYGGTNLGVGGLVRAYTRAVTTVIDEAGVIEEVPHHRRLVTVEYDDSGTVRGILESADCAFDAEYEERVSFDVRVPVVVSERLWDRIRSATAGRAEIE